MTTGSEFSSVYKFTGAAGLSLNRASILSN